MSSIPVFTLAPADLSELLESDSSLALIDVRTEEEFAEEHVPGATCMPLDRIDPLGLRARGTYATDQALYLLCRSGKRASHAAELFLSAGFTRVVVVAGGTLAWIEAGLPVIAAGIRNGSPDSLVGQSAE